MSSQTIAPVPNYDNSVQELIEQHEQFSDEPLLLALRYYPARKPGDVFLFEVIGDFGGGRISDYPELYEVEIGSTESFPLSGDHTLHLVLTSPEELAFAAQNEWPLFREVREAVRNGSYQVLYPNDALLGLLQ